MVNTRGESGPDQALSGYYFREARFLSTCQLEIHGHPPWLSEVAAVEPDVLEFSYAFPEVTNYGGGGSGQSGDEEPRDERGLPQRGLNIQLTYRVRIASLEVSAAIVNSSKETLEFDVGWHFDADFADIQEAQGARREQEAAVQIQHREAALAFEYAHERLPYRSDIAFPQHLNWQIAARQASTHVRLEAQERDEWLAMQAGVPLYPAFFGRDAVTAGWQAAIVDRGECLDAALTKLGRHQSARFDDWRDEEPGRIPYQMRRGPLAILDINPYAAYYAEGLALLMAATSLWLPPRQ